MVTNLADLTDEMYEKADMHDEHGAWQMIFGLNTIPACRKKGYAGIVLRRIMDGAAAGGDLRLQRQRTAANAVFVCAARAELVDDFHEE